MKSSIKMRLFVWFIMVSVIPLLVIGGFSYYLISDKIRQQNEENINHINRGIYNMVDTQQKVVSNWLESSAEFFTEKLRSLGKNQFDFNDMVEISGYRIPTWYIGKQKITGDDSLVDILIEREKLPATIFQFYNNKFIRVSSNVRHDDGIRIVGTVLESGPVYEKLINGQQYLGRANVEGIMHATIYQPIFGDDGKLIGAFVLGRREQEYELTNAIQNIAVGSSGYVGVMDPHGVFIIHPTLKGKDVSSYPWVQEILQKKNGSITYDLGGQEKIAYYMYYEPWNWYIVTGGYVSEIFNTTRSLSQALFMACFIVVAISSAIAYLLSDAFFRPINELTEVMRQVQSGNLTARLNYSSDDEFRIVSNAFNAMMNNISLLIGRLLSNSLQLKEASNNLLDDITDSKEALGIMASGVDSLRQSINTTAASTTNDEFLKSVDDINTMLINLDSAVKNRPIDDPQMIQQLMENFEVLRRNFIEMSVVGQDPSLPANAISIQNKLNNLEVELAKLKLLIRHISSSASSLDGIATSLDRNVNIFKVRDNE